MKTLIILIQISNRPNQETGWMAEDKNYESLVRVGMLSKETSKSKPHLSEEIQVKYKLEEPGKKALKDLLKYAQGRIFGEEKETSEKIYYLAKDFNGFIITGNSANPFKIDKHSKIKIIDEKIVYIVLEEEWQKIDSRAKEFLEFNKRGLIDEFEVMLENISIETLLDKEKLERFSNAIFFYSMDHEIKDIFKKVKEVSEKQLESKDGYALRKLAEIPAGENISKLLVSEKMALGWINYILIRPWQNVTNREEVRKKWEKVFPEFKQLKNTK